MTQKDAEYKPPEHEFLPDAQHHNISLARTLYFYLTRKTEAQDRIIDYYKGVEKHLESVIKHKEEIWKKFAKDEANRVKSDLERQIDDLTNQLLTAEERCAQAVKETEERFRVTIKEREERIASLLHDQDLLREEIITLKQDLEVAYKLNRQMREASNKESVRIKRLQQALEDNGITVPVEEGETPETADEEEAAEEAEAEAPEEEEEEAPEATTPATAEEIDEIERLNTQIARLNGLVIEATAQIQAKDEAIATHTETVRELSCVKNEYSSARESISQLEVKNEELEANNRTLLTERERLSVLNAELSAKAHQATEKMAAMEQEKQTLQDENTQLQSKMQASSESNERQKQIIAEQDEELENLRAGIVGHGETERLLREAKEDLRKTQEEADTSIAEIRAKLETKERTIEQIAQDFRDRNASQEDLEMRCSEKDSEVETIKYDLEQATQQMQAMQAEFQRQIAEIQQTHANQVHALQSQIQSQTQQLQAQTPPTAQFDVDSMLTTLREVESIVSIAAMSMKREDDKLNDEMRKPINNDNDMLQEIVQFFSTTTGTLYAAEQSCQQALNQLHSHTIYQTAYSAAANDASLRERIAELEGQIAALKTEGNGVLVQLQMSQANAMHLTRQLEARDAAFAECQATGTGCTPEALQMAYQRKLDELTKYTKLVEHFNTQSEQLSALTAQLNEAQTLIQQEANYSTDIAQQTILRIWGNVNARGYRSTEDLSWGQTISASPWIHVYNVLSSYLIPELINSHRKFEENANIQKMTALVSHLGHDVEIIYPHLTPEQRAELKTVRLVYAIIEIASVYKRTDVTAVATKIKTLQENIKEFGVHANKLWNSLYSDDEIDLTDQEAVDFFKGSLDEAIRLSAVNDAAIQEFQSYRIADSPLYEEMENYISDATNLQRSLIALQHYVINIYPNVHQSTQAAEQLVDDVNKNIEQVKASYSQATEQHLPPLAARYVAVTKNSRRSRFALLAKQ